MIEKEIFLQYKCSCISVLLNYYILIFILFLVCLFCCDIKWLEVFPTLLPFNLHLSFFFSYSNYFFYSPPPPPPSPTHTHTPHHTTPHHTTPHTPHHTPHTTHHTLNIESYQRKCIVLLDEVYIKSAITYHGGSLFGKSLDNPERLARTVLCNMIKCRRRKCDRNHMIVTE